MSRSITPAASQVASEEFGPAIWLKLDPQDPNNHVLLSHGDLIITEDPRFSVRHHPNDNIYVLKVKGGVGWLEVEVEVQRECIGRKGNQREENEVSIERK